MFVKILRMATCNDDESQISHVWSWEMSASIEDLTIGMMVWPSSWSSTMARRIDSLIVSQGKSFSQGGVLVNVIFGALNQCCSTRISVEGSIALGMAVVVVYFLWFYFHGQSILNANHHHNHNHNHSLPHYSKWLTTSSVVNHDNVGH